MTTLLQGRIVLHGGDNREVMKGIESNSIDSIVTDPPYALVSVVKRFGGDGAAACKTYEGGTGAYARASAGFMGKTWDTGETAFSEEFWRECFRVLKPGGHVVSFGGTRTNHRLVCAIEDAGFEIRDMIAWLYGTGFPKSHDVSKGIDKAAGVERDVVGKDPQAARRNKTTSKFSGVYGEIEDAVSCPITAPATAAAREWQGWGTALKPALEPICLARKPLEAKTVVANVLLHGTGAINIDASRVNATDTTPAPVGQYGGSVIGPNGHSGIRDGSSDALGRWPANVLHDGSDEVTSAFPCSDSRGGKTKHAASVGFSGKGNGADTPNYGNDSGSAARFFYSPKANKRDRAGSKHPTVKPINLMQYLCTLVTPPGGTVLDPFAGSGTTGEAAIRGGFNAILIEREPEYLADIFNRFVTMDESANEPATAHANDNAQIDIEDAIRAAA